MQSITEYRRIILLIDFIRYYPWCFILGAKSTGGNKLTSQFERSARILWIWIMFRAVVGAWWVLGCIKMIVWIYFEFLKAHIELWFKKNPKTFRKKIVFNDDNVQSYLVRKRNNLIKWISKTLFWWSDRLVRLILNQFWNILKNNVLINEWQFTSNDEH